MNFNRVPAYALIAALSGGDVDALYGENRTKFAPTGQTITDGRSKTINADYGLPVAGGRL